MRRTTPNLILVAMLLGAMLVAGCADTPELPSQIVISPDDFGADDTSFVRITPDWGPNAGFDWQQPNELHVARDGFFYVCDEANNGRVSRLQLDGSVQRDDLFREVIDTSGRFPIGLGQDSKLNLFLANGSNVIHARNVAVERIGLSAVMSSFEVIDLQSEDQTRYTINNSIPIWQQFSDLADMGVDSLEVNYDSAIWEESPDTLAFFDRPFVFVADTSGERTAQFSDVSGGAAGENRIFAADQGNDRIVAYDIQPARILLLEDGSTTYSFTGVYAGDAVEFGSGQVSTNNPTSVVTDGAGASLKMFYTQVDGNFLVQRLRSVGPTWQFDIATTETGPPISQLGYFGKPVAVAAGEADDVGLGLFYVADSLQNRVTSFYPSGSTFRHVAAESELIDLQPGQSVEEAVAAMGREFDPALNYELDDYVAAEDVLIDVEAGQSLGDALAEEGYEFDPALNENLSAGTVYERDTTVRVNVPVEVTVQVHFATLDTPRGVATREGVVYIADSGNNRILRFSRSDSDSYIPNDPNL